MSSWMIEPLPARSGNDTTCVICRRQLFSSTLTGDRRTDVDWDEERCYPHDDPEKLHITLRMLFDCAVNYDAPRPHQVAQAMAIILWYEYEAPDNAVEQDFVTMAAGMLR